MYRKSELCTKTFLFTAMKVRYTLILFLFLLFYALPSHAQLFSVDGSSPVAGWTYNNVSGNAIQRSGYWLLDDDAEFITSDVYDVCTFTNLSLSVNIASFSSGTHATLTIEYSLDGGTTWEATTFTTPPTTGSSYDTHIWNLGTQATSQLQFRFVRTAGSGTRGVRLQDIVLSGTPGGSCSGGSGGGGGASTDGGIVVNEISNGSSGAQEFMEFLVIGSSANPTQNVDLTGWIIDDNSGAFGSGSGQGIAAGYLTITGACLSNVPPGALIVIYNDDEPNANLPANDPTDSNGDGVYVFPANYPCFSYCTTNPNTSGSSYIPCTGGLQSAASLANPWDRLSLRNGGDAAQTRRPDGTFFHGFSYGNLGNGPTFNLSASNGGGQHYYLNCGDWNSAANYLFGPVGTAPAESPGAANTAENQTLIDEITAGSFDYLNPNLASNCDDILPLRLLEFEATRQGEFAHLRWETADEREILHFSIERSTDGQHFEAVGQKKAQNENFAVYTFKDAEPHWGKTYYYRLKIHEQHREAYYSPVRALYFEAMPENNLAVFPNPADTYFLLHGSLPRGGQLFVWNAQGQYVTQRTFSNLNEIKVDCTNWPQGLYILKVVDAQGHCLYSKKVLRQ